mmetsp:Transcript_52232/g.121951  ORF Transcript_52232/g.121951 Transcript_52232/m.121951 type:complete len:630 (+) Transcript_52232:100-1989(+)
MAGFHMEEEDESQTDPVLSAHCEAAGLELAVRTWWKGAPGRRTPKEDSWLKKNAAGGLQAGAHQRLQRGGIPESVLRSGVQLGQALAKDSGVSKNWRQFVENAGTPTATSPVVGSPLSSPAGAKTPRGQNFVRKFQVKLMEEVSQNFALRLPKSSDGGLELSPRQRRPEVDPSLASARRNEAGERYPPLIEGPSQPPTRPIPPSPQIRAAGGMAPRQDMEEAFAGRAAKVLPDLPGTSQVDELEQPEQTSNKGWRSARAPPKREESKGSKPRPPLLDVVGGKDILDSDRTVTPKAPGTPGDSRSTSKKFAIAEGRSNSKKLQEIFTETSRKLLDEGRSQSVRPGSSHSDCLTSSTSLRLAKSGTPRRAITSRFDEWSKKQEERLLEETKEYEEECRQKADMGYDSIASKASTLLNDKNVAPEIMNKKAVHDLNSIKRIFSHFDQDGSGFIEPPEFIPLLAKLLRRPAEDLDKSEVWAVWDQVDADGSGSIDFDEFQKWYADLMGIDILDYKENFIPDDISEDQKMVRNVAKSMGRSILEIEKLYDEFRKLDTDGSNTLESNEFKVLIQRHFAPKGPEVPEHVFKMFWKDFDKGGSGSVTFMGFVTWYLKYMKGDQDPMQMYWAYMSASR